VIATEMEEAAVAEARRALVSKVTIVGTPVTWTEVGVGILANRSRLISWGAGAGRAATTATRAGRNEVERILAVKVSIYQRSLFCFSFIDGGRFGFCIH
jgi:hypothetical protein